jgi:Winged helix DNA-binding domain
VRALPEAGPVTMAEGLSHLEQVHGLTGIRARRAWHGGRMRAHVLHHHETALWRGRPEGRFVAIDEPEPLDPTEARAEMLRRYLAAFGPASRKDMDKWSMMRQPAIKAALARIEPLRRFRAGNRRLSHRADLGPLIDFETTPRPHRRSTKGIRLACSGPSR